MYPAAIPLGSHSVAVPCLFIPRFGNDSVKSKFAYLGPTTLNSRRRLSARLGQVQPPGLDGAPQGPAGLQGSVRAAPIRGGAVQAVRRAERRDIHWSQ
eukprot:g19176.t1